MIKVGIIGTGIIASEHAQAIVMVPDSVRLVAAADLVPERLEEFCANFGVSRRYASAAELIADPEVELVAVATPPSGHEEAVVAALRAGKYVLCEKPLAQSLAAAGRITEAEARHPGRLATSYQLRYEPSYRRLLWLCQNGWIGDIQSASIERHGYIPHVGAGKGGWWGAWSVAGGGVLMTQLIHEIDLMLQAMGQARSVRAEMDTRYTSIESEDWIEAEIQFDGGRTARFAASVNSGQMRGGFVVKGSLGTVSPGQIVLNDPTRQALALRAVDAALPDTKPASMSFQSRALRKIGRSLGVRQKPALTPHALLYRDIARNIAGRLPLPIPPGEALKSLQLCAAAYESALAGKEIGLPLDSAASVYNGVSKVSYDARKIYRMSGTQSAVRRRSSNVIRVGLIGLDTSHAPAFTALLHDPYNPQHIPGARVVAAYPGGSPDMPVSISRVPGFTSELRDKYCVPIMDSPEGVAEAADIVFILSSDGRTHTGLFRSVAGRGKPVFIDKPFAISFSDAEQIYAMAKETGTKVFASSAFRYADGLVAGLNSILASGEKIKTCRIRYWMQIQPTQGRYFWYGIHASEMLLAVMGKGAVEVESSSKGDRDTITVWHQDGRQSSLVGALNDGAFHVTIETDKRTLELDLGPSISSVTARMLAAALDVLTDEQFPQLWGATLAGSVSRNRPGRALDPDAEETLEVIRLLDAAQRSYASRQKTAL